MKLTVNKANRSSLVPTPEGILKVRFIQAATGREVLGIRGALAGAEGPITPTAKQRADCSALLDNTQADALNVLSFHPGITACAAKVKCLSKTRTIGQ